MVSRCSSPHELRQKLRLVLQAITDVSRHPAMDGTPPPDGEPVRAVPKRGRQLTAGPDQPHQLPVSSSEHALDSALFRSAVLCATYSPEGYHGTGKPVGCKGRQSSKGPFSGSMLIFGSVNSRTAPSQEPEAFWWPEDNAHVRSSSTDLQLFILNTDLLQLFIFCPCQGAGVTNELLHHVVCGPRW